MIAGGHALIDLASGERLGRYTIRQRLGAGGMGVVYRAVETDTGEQVALKLLPVLEPAALYRFKREFRALAELDHPNLVRLHELTSDGERWFFTMELIDGVDFLAWTRCLESTHRAPEQRSGTAGPPELAFAQPCPLSRPQQFERVRTGVRALARALATVHAAGKVHRDIKPSNILVTADQRVVLLDFGLVSTRPGHSHHSDSDVVGTARYMAPEQSFSRKVGPAADWYAVGTMIYEALTGQPPFDGSPIAMMMEKQEVEPRPPRALAPELPDDLNDLCVALLRRSPGARPSGAAVLETLGEAAPQLPSGTPASGSSPLFVGRATELEQLAQQLANARHGQSSITVLRGESGVGKTALVRTFLHRAREQYPELTALTGRCYARESMPYKAFDGIVDELSEYLRRLEQDELEQQLPADAPLLARLFPVLGRVPAIAHMPRPHRADQPPLQLRARAFEALRDLLHVLADHRTVLLFIDDLQRADPDSIALAGDVLREPDAPAIAVIATLRTEHDHPIPELITELLGRLERTTDLTLGPLTDADATELANRVAAEIGAETDIDAAAVVANAGGLPLFIDELVRHVANTRAPEAAAERLDDALWARVQRLDGAARRLLELCAIAEVPLSIATIARAANFEEQTALQRVQQLRREHLARTTGTMPSDTIEPYHDRVREAVVSRLEPSTRVESHRRLADALQEAGAAELDPQVLVHHLTEAGAAEQAAGQAEAAAWRASEALAFDQAAELFRVVLQLGDLDLEAQHKLRLRLAETLTYAGRGLEAAEVYLTVAASTDDVDLRLDCKRRAGEQLLLTGHLAEGTAAVREVLAAVGARLPPTPQAALRALLWERARLRLRGLRWTSRKETELPARSLAELDTLHSVGTILTMVDTIVGHLFTVRATRLALRLGERDRVIRALAQEAIGCASTGQLPRAERIVDQLRALTADASPALKGWTTSASGVVHFLAGRYRQAVDDLETAIELTTSTAASDRRRMRLGGYYETTVLRQFRMFALSYLGHGHTLERELEDALRAARRTGDRYTEATLTRALNIVWLYADNPAEARQRLSALGWSPAKDGYHLQHWLKLRARGNLLLYCASIARARAQLQPGFEALEHSQLLRVRQIRVDYWCLAGRLALAEQDAQLDHAPALGEIAKVAAKLERERWPHATALARLLRAGIAARANDRTGALAHLAEAEQIAVTAELPMFAAAAMRTRGLLLAGSDGAELIERADRRLRAEAVRSPARLVAMMVPGFGATEVGTPPADR